MRVTLPLVALAVVGALVTGGALAAAAAALVAVATVQAVALGRLRAQTAGLAQLARSDDLTGLGNARAMWEDLDALLASGSLAMVIADLDHFKQINDQHGHGVGDAVLRAVGAAVSGVAGPAARCYRYGGEELVVILPAATEPSAARLAERVRLGVADGFPGLPHVSISAGVTVATHGTPAWAAFDRADDALRRAKLAGRDRVVCASTLGHQQSAEDASTVAARRAALAIATAALEARDTETAGHSDDVVLLCEAITDRLGIVGLEREHLLAAARLHDVGKVAIPHEILAKPGPLDDSEWAVMRQHTVTGEQILSAVPEMAPIAPLVRSAHERYDGTGYPDGLAGEDIPLGSRVILCADAFHAIRSDRPYRASQSPQAAIEELEANAGSQFDPVVAATLVDVVREANGPKRGPGRRRFSGSPRLLALLATTAVTGTAVAAVPSLRDAVNRMLPGSERQASAPLNPRVAGAPATCAELALEGLRCTSGGVFAPLAVRVASTPVRARGGRSADAVLVPAGRGRTPADAVTVAVAAPGAPAASAVVLVDELADASSQGSSTAPEPGDRSAASTPVAQEDAEQTSTSSGPSPDTGSPAPGTPQGSAKTQGNGNPDPGTPQGNTDPGTPQGNPNPGTPQGNGNGNGNSHGNGNPDPGTPQGGAKTQGNGNPDPGTPQGNGNPDPGTPQGKGNGNGNPSPGPKPESSSPPVAAPEDTGSSTPGNSGGANGNGNGNDGSKGGHGKKPAAAGADGAST